MKVTYSRISADDGFREGMIIKGETEFEKEYMRVHNFPKMHDGDVVITERKEGDEK